jgi:tetratricopeptide (TPR) repeat protein
MPALPARALLRLVVAFFDWDRWPETIEAGKRFVAASTRGSLTHSDTAQGALLAYATAHARMGERDESDRVLRLVGDAPPDTVQFISLGKARLALARGAEREARQLLLAGLDAHSGRMALPALLAELAELGARGGDRDLYERFGAQAQELGWRSGARKALAQAIRARGIVAMADGRWDDALGDLESALNRYRELDTPWEEARARYALAGCYRRRSESGDDERARDELREALRLFERLHAVRDIARARAALAGGDVRLP